MWDKKKGEEGGERLHFLDITYNKVTHSLSLYPPQSRLNDVYIVKKSVSPDIFDFC